jgi:hypothetical protein
MGELISLEGEREKKEREDRANMVERLEELLQAAKDGEIIAVSYVAINTGREGLTVGHLKTGECGVHELVGATRILADGIAMAMAKQEDD